jgi:NDP-sugar pyrophosphorylase family protein
MEEDDAVRAMILAAGLGTRMRPLTDHRAKPALPVRGRPVISLLLELLARHGFREVMINLHHRPETIRRAVDLDHPAGVEITWSEEDRPLGTGGGIRRAARFLRESEACVVLAGDMLLDVDLRKLFDLHRESGRAATLLLREDERGERFGTIGVDSSGRVCRIGKRHLAPAAPGSKSSMSAETAKGLFLGVRFFSREVLDHWPAPGGDAAADRESGEPAFEDLRDWLAPGIEVRGESIGGELLGPSSGIWEPVGTPAEYLRVNLAPPDLPSLGGAAAIWEGAIELRGPEGDVIVGQDAEVPESADLRRCVVWDGERVPADLRAHDGVFAGGVFHSCRATDPRCRPSTGLENRA